MGAEWLHSAEWINHSMSWRGFFVPFSSSATNGSSGAGSRPKRRWKSPRCSSRAGRSSMSPVSGNESGTDADCDLLTRCRKRPDLDSACMPTTVTGPAPTRPSASLWVLCRRDRRCNAGSRLEAQMFSDRLGPPRLGVRRAELGQRVADRAEWVGGCDLGLEGLGPLPVGVVAEYPAHGARHHGRRGPSRVQIHAG